MSSIIKAGYYAGYFAFKTITTPISLTSTTLNYLMTKAYPSEEKKTYDTLIKIKSKLKEENINKNFSKLSKLPENWEYSWFKSDGFYKKIAKAKKNIVEGAKKPNNSYKFNLLEENINTLKLQNELLKNECPLLIDSTNPYLLTEKDLDILSEDYLSSRLTEKIRNKQFTINVPGKISQKSLDIIDLISDLDLSINQKKMILNLQEDALKLQQILENYSKIANQSKNPDDDTKNITNFQNCMINLLDQILHILLHPQNPIKPSDIPKKENLEKEMNEIKTNYTTYLIKKTKLTPEEKNDLLDIQSDLLYLKGNQTMISLFENRLCVMDKIEELKQKTLINRVKKFVGSFF